jgi:hypothetical protein
MPIKNEIMNHSQKRPISSGVGNYLRSRATLRNYLCLAGSFQTKKPPIAGRMWPPPGLDRKTKSTEHTIHVHDKVEKVLHG